MLVAAGVSGAAVLKPDSRTTHALAVRADPFALGVAAGDPLPDSLILWTRLVKNPLDAASMPNHDVTVQYEVCTDARFQTGVRRGDAIARWQWAHSVHVTLTRLEPATLYYYRFRTGTFISPVGRARTAPAAGTRLSDLRFAIANCQDYQSGYWPAYSAMASEDIDFVLHLGDYIYEGDPLSVYHDRLHTKPQRNGLIQLLTLSDFRDRHAQYKLDPALQAAHQHAAWIATWDDHEVENNYAGDIDEITDTGAKHQSRVQFRAERAAAYQAYYEHMPIRVKYSRGSSSLKLYRSFDFGDLARFSVLDTRQYRTDQPAGYGNDTGPESAGTKNVNGTLTGATQESWLKAQLAGSSAQWNVIAQQVMVSRTRMPSTRPGTPYIFNLDSWDGYAPFRARLLNYIQQQRVANPIVLSGDVHATWMNDLVLHPNDPAATVIASEFVSTSISSPFGSAQDALIKKHLSAVNPKTRYFDGSRRGYLRIHVNRERWLTEARTVASVAHRTSPISTTAHFAVESGRPGILPA
jgi:alkaline phosphatase D